MKLFELNEEKKKKVTQMSSNQDDYDIGNFAINKQKENGPKRWYLGNVKGNEVKTPTGPFKGKAEEYNSHLL